MSGNGERGWKETIKQCRRGRGGGTGAVDKATVLYGKSRRVMGEGAQWK